MRGARSHIDRDGDLHHGRRVRVDRLELLLLVDHHVVRRGAGPRGAARHDVLRLTRVARRVAQQRLAARLVLLRGLLHTPLVVVAAHGLQCCLTVSLRVQVVRVHARHVPRVARYVVLLGRRVRRGELSIRDELAPLERVAVGLALRERRIARLPVCLRHLMLATRQEPGVPAGRADRRHSARHRATRRRAHPGAAATGGRCGRVAARCGAHPGMWCSSSSCSSPILRRAEAVWQTSDRRNLLPARRSAERT